MERTLLRRMANDPKTGASLRSVNRRQQQGVPIEGVRGMLYNPLTGEQIT